MTYSYLGCPWPERDGDLKRLWDEGYSTAEIGRRMDLSKNAIVGRAHRLNLSARTSPIIRTGAPKPRTPRPLVRSAYNPHVILDIPQLPLPTPFRPARPGKCRFLTGERHSYVACDAPTTTMLDGGPSPYCRVHHVRCYVPCGAPSVTAQEMAA